MFKRSRKKIILSIMLSLILLFAVTLSVIMLASYREMRRQNTEMLERYAELYSLEPQPGGQNEPEPGPDSPDFRPRPEGPDDPKGKPPEERPGYQLSTFYSVAFSEDGTALSVNDGAKGLYSEDELVSIARDLLKENKTAGRLDSLSYTISSRPGYTLVAFIDDTVTESSLKTLLHNVLIIGGAAIVVLFFISLYLSKRIIRPLEENDEQQKRFISDASHELKTPVSVISANAELLSRELGENEWLSNIRYENDRMGGLVKQLLDLSRAENAETPMEQLDFSRIVTGEALAFESLAFEHGKILRSAVDEGLILKGNQTQLTQIVSVLLDNAIRHSTGSEISLSLKRRGHTAVLTVENEGKAIPTEKLYHLFDRFFRLDEARAGEGQHYGLGLSIAKAVAGNHGGSIEASCPDGKVRFTVALPTD